jgi:hypothetical protein
VPGRDNRDGNLSIRLFVHEPETKAPGSKLIHHALKASHLIGTLTRD